MKRKILSGFTAAVLMGLCLCSPAESLSVSANNPICQTSFTPDPAPVVFGDTLYVYTGCDRDGNNDFYYMTGYQCFSTTDMQNWTNHGTIMQDSDFSWGKKDSAWASQCVERNGKYYFYVTMECSNGGGRGIGVAVADSPTGPFKDALGKPLCGPNWDYIDPTVLIDDDGQAWLMFGNPTCYYVKLNEDMLSLSGQIQHFDMNSSAFGPSSKTSAYGEGPWIYKRGNLYYLVYAAFYGNDGGESMCYSTGPSITGPWTYRGQIMKTHNCFTTHGGIIDFQGKSYFFYHKNGLPGGGTFNRSACVEEFEYGSDGSIPMLSPTNDGPKQLKPFNPYERVEAETMCWSSGIKTEPIDVGTQAIGFIENGDYTMVKGVDFGEAGATEFTVSASSGGEGGKIELHLDSATGPIIGTVTVPVTGDWQKWETLSTTVMGATGQHDLYLRFAGSDGYLFNVDWWEFTGEEEVSFVRGDVNADSAVTVSDLTLAKKVLMGTVSDKAMVKAADVNHDGTVSMEDLVWYVKYLTGQVSAFPE